MSTISIALLNPHHLFRSSIACLIQQQGEGYTVSIEASCYEELLEEIQTKGIPQVILLSLALPNRTGYEVAGLLRKLFPTIKIVALCAICTPFSVRYMVENGACAYLSTFCTPQHLLSVLSTVSSFHFEHHGMGSLITQRVLPPEIKSTELLSGVHLTDKEVRFLQLCCGPLTYQQMEKEFCTSRSCVDKMREKLFEKLGLGSRQELAIFALVNGLRVDLIPFTFEKARPQQLLQVA